MTNREWLFKKMKNMSDEEFATSVVLPEEAFEEQTCIGCCNNCRNEPCVVEWLKSERKEKITLSEAERIILENIDKEYKWIARDEDDEIRVFNKKPEEDVDCRIWICGTGEKNARLSAINHLFQFITWEDEQAYNIEELLEGGNSDKL